jgi:predicted GTPase
VKGSPQQEEIVYTAVDTIIKFLDNDPSYKPMHAMVMGCGGTGKSHIINTIIGMVRTLTNSNNTVQIVAPSGAATFNVQGSTLHSLLNIGVANPEKEISEKRKEQLRAQLQRLLILVIDERSMISSKVLAAAERNTRECIYNGQNSTELWGGVQ